MLWLISGSQLASPLIALSIGCPTLPRHPSPGYIFTPQRYARDNLSHPPHVMSDHILLASAVHGGLASEALLPLLSWRHAGGCRWAVHCVVLLV